MRIETLAIGDELLTGKISDTNSAYVAAELFKNGLRLDRCSVVPDDESAIRNAFEELGARCRFVVCFGGLGPTSDDKTALVVANHLGTEVEDHPESLAQLQVFARKRNRELTPQLLKQIKTPKGSRALFNKVGLAPGFVCTLGKAQFYFLPGVPHEMKPLFTQEVLPELLQANTDLGGGYTHSHVWKCVGIPESELQRLMDPVEAALPAGAWLGYRTKSPENHLVLYWKAPARELPSKWSAFVERIRSLLAPYSFTEDNHELESLVIAELKSRGARVALAESCTGGVLAQRLTSVAGSSEVFWGSAVVYQTGAKASLLSVRVSDVEAVSARCSRELALHLREKSGCEYALAITGYMGPTGGTDKDPVGTVYLAVAGPSGMSEERIQIPTRNREVDRYAASTYALNRLRLVLGQRA